MSGMSGMDERSDLALVEAANRGEREALEALYLRHAWKVREIQNEHFPVE